MLDNKKHQISFNFEVLLNHCLAKDHNNSVQIILWYFTNDCLWLFLLLLQGEVLPDLAIGSNNQRGNVPDVAMNADQQYGVSSQEPFYSSLNTTKPTVKITIPVTMAGGDYTKINKVR